MILGIGTDLCRIDRIKKALENARFLERVYTESERSHLEGMCQGRIHERAAGFFAAKEAVAKALGTGFAGFGPADIEILYEEAGRPYAVLHGRAGEIARGARIHLSITHEDNMAQAFAVLESEDER